jgi:aerobic-type carbon monoxide dehydrogenase small subunit (CoxS/CutS family)
MIVGFTLNGRGYEVEAGPHQTLLEVLRDTLENLEAKEGCSEGACGACTVLLDGRPVASCLVLVPLVDGRSVMTVRGLEPEGRLHPLQESLLEHGAVQCGFCIPGVLLTSVSYVHRHPDADREQIRAALAGNLCRCTGYTKIVDAVEAWAQRARAGG